jgi:hypothetical protein
MTYDIRDRLIIFDYSGTLSTGAVLFGRPEYLMDRLKKSGLAALGVTGLDIFWNDIVNPTWNEGSTSSSGYKNLMIRQVKEIVNRSNLSTSDKDIINAVSRFVDSYFTHSRIDMRWQPILRKLAGNLLVLSLIASDHYAEATDYIVQFLRDLQVQGKPVMEVFHGNESPSFIVANSADLGFHKDDLRFWEFLKSNLRMEMIRQILLIDDFGYNESRESRYSHSDAIEARKRDIVSIVEEVFSVPVETAPFMINVDERVSRDFLRAERERLYDELITKTASIIEDFMTR